MAATLPRQAEKASGRADEIVELASRLFHERGYPGVSMRSLAQAAGIQGGSLYHHFASKEEILYRITLYGSEDFFAGLLPVLRGPDPYGERLETFVRRYVHDSRGRRHAIAVLFRDMRHLAPEHFAELQAIRRRFQQAVQRFLADGVAAGAFSTPDAKVAGIAVLDLLKGIDEWVREPGRLSYRQVADTYAVLITQMMGPGDGVSPGETGAAS